MRHQPASGLRRFATLPLGGGMETVLVGGVGWHWTALNEQWFFMAGGRALTLGGCSVALCGPGAERKAAAVADVNGKWCACTPVVSTQPKPL